MLNILKYKKCPVKRAIRYGDHRMASDIFFSGNGGRPSRDIPPRQAWPDADPAGDGSPRLSPDPAAAAERVRVTRGPADGAAPARSGYRPQRQPADDARGRAAAEASWTAARAQRSYRNTAPSGRAAPRFSETVRPAAHTEDLITEEIDSELLHRPPTQIPYNYIMTDDDFDEFGGTDPLYDKERERKRRKAQKKAKKNFRHPGKKKGGLLKPLTVILSLLLAAILLMSGAAVYVVSGCKPQPLAANESADPAGLLTRPSVYNLLLLGIDTQNTADSSRSDSMLLLSVDNAHGKLKLTSFLRDCYVYIPGHGDDKLNAACTYGGPQLVRDTIEYNFGIRIDGCVKIGYDILIDLVDGIGGITIPEVDAVEAAALAAEGYNAPIGTDIKMNGLQALTYCRIRKGQTDFFRTERQREVLGIILRKALRTSPLRLAKLGRRLLSKAECSVERKDLFVLVFRALPCLLGGISSDRVPQDGTWYDDTRNYQDVLVVNFEENKAFLKDFIYS